MTELTFRYLTLGDQTERRARCTSENIAAAMDSAKWDAVTVVVVTACFPQTAGKPAECVDHAILRNLSHP